MSEPYIKVWAADMRGDAKIRALTKAVPHGAYMLIQAWDLAKNGAKYSELRDPFGAPMTPQNFAELVGIPTRHAVTFFSQIVTLELAELEDGVLVFPTLARRQASAKTPAQRQKEYRDRQREERASRNGTRNESVTPDVTSPVTDPVTSVTPDVTNRYEAARNEVTKPFARARASQTPDPDNNLEPIGQSTVSPPSAQTAVTDQISINAKDLNPEIRRAAEWLLADLADRDAGTPGRLVELARRGATEADFYDAREAIRTTTPRSASKVACTTIENRLKMRNPLASGDVPI